LRTIIIQEGVPSRLKIFPDSRRITFVTCESFNCPAIKSFRVARNALSFREIKRCVRERDALPREFRKIRRNTSEAPYRKHRKHTGD